MLKNLSIYSHIHTIWFTLCVVFCFKIDGISAIRNNVLFQWEPIYWDQYVQYRMKENPTNSCILVKMKIFLRHNFCFYLWYLMDPFVEPCDENDNGTNQRKIENSSKRGKCLKSWSPGLYFPFFLSSRLVFQCFFSSILSQLSQYFFFHTNARIISSNWCLPFLFFLSWNLLNSSI